MHTRGLQATNVRFRLTFSTFSVFKNADLRAPGPLTKSVRISPQIIQMGAHSEAFMQSGGVQPLYTAQTCLLTSFGYTKTEKTSALRTRSVKN